MTRPSGFVRRSVPARLATLTLSLGVVAAACGGPPKPFRIAVKDLATDVILGAQTTLNGEEVTPVIVPPIPAPAPLSIPSFIPAAPTPTTQAPDPRPEPVELCPATSQLAPIRQEARSRVDALPAEHEYAFHNVGTFDIEGAIPASGDYELVSQRRIENVDGTPDEFTYDLVSEVPTTGTVTTTYHVVRRSALGEVVGVDATQDAGIFVQRTVTVAPDDTVTTMTWSPELLLLPFPASPGVAWEASATDPASGVVQQYHGEVVATARVEACGTPLSAWEVEISGHILGPGRNLALTATYWVAPQYGALVVKDLVSLEGTVGVAPGSQLATTNDATIVGEPEDPVR